LRSHTDSALLSEGFGAALALLLETLGNELLVLLGLSLDLLMLGLLGGLADGLATKSDGGDEPLDLRAVDVLNAVLLGSLAVGGDVLADVVLLGKVEHLADTASSLRTTKAGLLIGGKTGEFLLTLLDDDKVEDSEVRRDDATTDGLATALTLPAAVTTEALVSRAHEEADTLVGENTLLHGETLLVLATHNLEDVALEVITKNITLNLGTDTPVIESTKLRFIINFHFLLAASGGVSNVELHF